MFPGRVRVQREEILANAHVIIQEEDEAVLQFVHRPLNGLALAGMRKVTIFQRERRGEALADLLCSARRAILDDDDMFEPLGYACLGQALQRSLKQLRATVCRDDDIEPH